MADETPFARTRARLVARTYDGALFRYQVMANIVGTLIIFLFTFFFINLATGHLKLMVEIFGVGHGYLYLVYLVTVAALWFKTRMSVIYALCMVAAGLIPTLTFVVEHYAVKRIKAMPQYVAEAAEREAAASRS